MLKLCHDEKECHKMEQLRQDIASSRPMQTKGCCKGNNYEQRFALDIRLSTIVDIKKNNSNNLYNNEQLFR